MVDSRMRTVCFGRESRRHDAWLSVLTAVLLCALVSCSPKSRTIANPNIDENYISYVISMTSFRAGSEITPGYNILFRKVSRNRVTRLRFWSTYYCGQTNALARGEEVDWQEGSPQLRDPNESGTTDFQVRLSPVKREAPKTEPGETTYGLPDSERIEVILWSPTEIEK